MSNSTKKNVVIIGAGPAGIFTAYKLCQSEKFNVIMIDKGHSLKYRHCPIRYGNNCANCSICSITHGFGGSGAFSDCKLSLSPYIGGNIIDIIGYNMASKYTNNVVDTFINFYKNCPTYGENLPENIVNKLNNVGLNLQYCPTKHLGTDGTLNAMTEMFKFLVEHDVLFRFNETFIDFMNLEDGKYVVKTKAREYTDHWYELERSYRCDYIVFAPGRSGNTWLKDTMLKHNVEVKNNSFDIGFRVEVPAKITKEITDSLYDMKISSTYTDQDTNDVFKVRTFCTNPYGFVSEEHYTDGTVCVNGHSYEETKSNNTNFAVLVTLPAKYNMDKTIQEYRKYHKNISFCTFTEILNNKLSNKIYTKPTLKTAEHSKVTEGFNSKALEYFIKFMSSFNLAYPGVASDSTNVYGLEAKFYSDTIKVNKNFETSVANVYTIGDGSGITRGIVQSGCSGLVVADDIIYKNNKV